MIRSKFGDFIAERRKARGIGLRTMADLMGISAAYWSDIEKGRRNPPAMDKIEEVARILELSQEEVEHIIDLAADDRGEIPMDLPEYIMESDLAKTALRQAHKNKNEGRSDITDKAWEEFIKAIGKK